MDYELLFALIIMWSATSACLAIFISIIFLHEGGAFHPHCVDVESRHAGFIVVKSRTLCKPDCAVKSISAYIAPRGSSSSKYFGSIIVIISMAGMFGCFRWYMIGDADETQAALSVVGFSFLLLICAFESDVSPDRFLEDKLMVTAWYLQRIGADGVLDFPLDVSNGAYRHFVRTSKHLRPLFEEFDRYDGTEMKKDTQFTADVDFPYRPWWAVIHMVGALAYLGCVAASIILNDVDDVDIYGVAYVMSASFALFSIMGYLSGTYMSLIRPLQGLVLVWNPFCRDKDYIFSLYKAVLDYKLCDNFFLAQVDTFKPVQLKIIRRRSTRQSDKIDRNINARIEARRTEMLAQMRQNESIGEKTHFLLRPIFSYIEKEPDNYLRYISSLFVILELIALLTPAVAMGMQWATALCPGPPMQSILELIASSYTCLSLSSDQCEFLMRAHCIMMR